MKVTYTTKDKQFVFEFDAQGTKDALQQVAHVQEVFEQEKCGHCGKRNFRYVHRMVGEDHYYEIQCKDCFFKLGLGQPKKDSGNLYPRRRHNKTKQAIGTNGWHKFDATDEAEE